MRRPTTPAVALALAATAAALAAGCGGGGNASGGNDDQGTVRSVLARFEAARRTGDAEAACKHLVAVEERGRIQVEGGAEAEAEAARGGSCEKAFEQATAQREQLKSYSERVGRVTVRGDKARADARIRVVRSDGTVLERTISYDLARHDGWRLVLRAE